MAGRLMIEIGTAGEHIACADLILQGMRASLGAPGLPYDVIGDMDGALLRFAVKSTQRARPRPGRTLTRPCYQFGIKRHGNAGVYTVDDAEFVALVALDIKAVAYIPVRCCPQIVHLDPPGPREYPNAKGPRGQRCKTFADMTWPSALARWRADDA